jgi:hypothetical protein
MDALNAALSHKDQRYTKAQTVLMYITPPTSSKLFIFADKRTKDITVTIETSGMQEVEQNIERSFPVNLLLK